MITDDSLIVDNNDIVILDKSSTAVAKESGETNGSTTSSWVGRDSSLILGDIDDSVDGISKEKLGERRVSNHSLSPSPENGFEKKVPQYNSFRVMKQKVKLMQEADFVVPSYKPRLDLRYIKVFLFFFQILSGKTGAQAS